MKRDTVDVLHMLGKHSWDEEGWFVPLADALEGVGSVEAAWQPPGGGNTIWQTVNHLNYYNGRFLARLNGSPFEEAPNNTSTFGEPGNPEDTDGWQVTLENTRRTAERLRQVLAERSHADLDEEDLGEKLAHLFMHDIHHTGQIVLIRKQQGTWPKQRE